VKTTQVLLDRRRRTTYRLLSKGRAAFERHVAVAGAYAAMVRGVPQTTPVPYLCLRLVS
jgi:DNA-binding PadR family transcriptional regulator